MSNTPRFINSPSWRHGGRNLAGGLILFGMFFALWVAALWVG